jgi:hypothetical protein
MATENFLWGQKRIQAELARLGVTGQQIIEACGWDREPPRFLVHDRDSRYGTTFHRRVHNLGITSIRTPFRSYQANAIPERWVRSVRNDCLDHR